MRKTDHYLNHKQEIQEEYKKLRGKIPKVKLDKTSKETAKEWSVIRRKKSNEQEKEKKLNLERMKRKGWDI